MALDSISKLGSLLGGLAKGQDTLTQNINPDEDEAFTQFFALASMEVHCTEVLSAYSYPTDSFILDHPVYGYLDSPVLKLDGGYAQKSALFPLTFPIQLGAEVTELSRIIF